MTAIEAIYDGSVLRPLEPLDLQPGTHVRLELEVVNPVSEEGESFIAVAQTLNLPGPPDWAMNLKEYLYRLA